MGAYLPSGWEDSGLSSSDPDFNDSNNSEYTSDSFVGSDGSDSMLGLLSRNNSPRASVVSNATSISTATFMEDTESEVSSSHQGNGQGERLDENSLLLMAALAELIPLIQKAVERIEKLEDTVEALVSNRQSAERQQSQGPDFTSPEARLSLPSDEGVRPSARNHERVHNRARHAPTTTPPGLRLPRGSATLNSGVRQYFQSPNAMSQSSGERGGSSSPQMDTHRTLEVDRGDRSIEG